MQYRTVHAFRKTTGWVASTQLLDDWRDEIVGGRMIGLFIDINGQGGAGTPTTTLVITPIIERPDYKDIIFDPRNTDGTRYGLACAADGAPNSEFINNANASNRLSYWTIKNSLDADAPVPILGRWRFGVTPGTAGGNPSALSVDIHVLVEIP